MSEPVLYMLVIAPKYIPFGSLFFKPASASLDLQAEQLTRSCVILDDLYMGVDAVILNRLLPE